MSDTDDARALRIGLAGLGTVGGGVAATLASHAELLAARAGRPLRLVAVSARNRGKNRGVDLSAVDWIDDPVALARRADLDVVVEVIGGSDGPAKAVAEAALGRGAHLVTANKAMLARHGVALAGLAERSGAALRFEAAVAGGLPIVKALAEGLAANRVGRLFGVLNGTCNFILTEMERTGREFAEVLAEAQEKGYAEADPSADVGGDDAAQKLALLASLAFGCAPDVEGVETRGIERISLADIRFARELGYRVKQLSVAIASEHGLARRVAPCLAPLAHPIAGLEGVTNAVEVTGDVVGATVYEGPGAGAGPTASAVVADLIDIARAGPEARMRPAFGVPAATLAPPVRVSAGALPAAHYLRLALVDVPGALAKVAAALGAEGVSIDQMRQIGRRPDPATVLIVTHEVAEARLAAALSAIGALEVCLAEPVALRILRD